MRKLSLIIAALTVAACASQKERIASGLTSYGLEEGSAACIGAHLERSLSMGQLRELGRVAAAARGREPEPRRLTIDDLLRAASEIRDPKIALEVAKAAGRCNLSPMGFAPAKFEPDDA